MVLETRHILAVKCIAKLKFEGNGRMVVLGEQDQLLAVGTLRQNVYPEQFEFRSEATGLHTTMPMAMFTRKIKADGMRPTVQELLRHIYIDVELV